MSRRRHASQRRQWVVAALLSVLLTGGLGYTGWRVLVGGSHPTLSLPWAGVSAADKALATQAIATFYAPLKNGLWPPAVSPAPDHELLQAVGRHVTQQCWASQTAAQRDYALCASQLQSLGWAVEQWTADRDDAELPPDLQALVPTYYKTLPLCPDGGDGYKYEHSQATGRFTITCPGRHHLLAGARSNSPEYSSQYGLSKLADDPSKVRPKVLSYTIASLQPDGSQVTAHVTEQVSFCGATRSVESTFTVGQVGDMWKVLVPSNGAAMSGRGVAETYLETLATLPTQIQTASASADDLTACSTHLKLLGSALDAYASDHGGQYPARLQELVPHYVRSLPRCPVEDTDYQYECRGEDYTLTCAGGHHVGCHVPEGYPRMDNMAGLELGPAASVQTSQVLRRVAH